MTQPREDECVALCSIHNKEELGGWGGGQKYSISYNITQNVGSNES